MEINVTDGNKTGRWVRPCQVWIGSSEMAFLRPEWRKRGFEAGGWAGCTGPSGTEGAGNLPYACLNWVTLGVEVPRLFSRSSQSGTWAGRSDGRKVCGGFLGVDEGCIQLPNLQHSETWAQVSLWHPPGNKDPAPCLWGMEGLIFRFMNSILGPPRYVIGLLRRY